MAHWRKQSSFNTQNVHILGASGKKRMCGSADVQQVKCGSKCGYTSAFYPTYSWRWISILTYDDVEQSSGILLFQQQVNDSHHLAGGSRRRRTAATAARLPWSSRRWPAAGGSWRRRTAATVARHPWSSHRWESCLGKIAEVVSRCLPRGFYLRVNFSWIVPSQTHPCRAPVRDSHAATELSWWSRNAAVPLNYSLLGSLPQMT